MSFLDIIEQKEDKIKKFNVWDKIGYGLGDLGCSSIFQLVNGYLMLFYTDIFGISAAFVGTLFVISRVLDAVIDPIMGVVVDKKKNVKNGRFRPYVVIFGIPMAIVGVLTFVEFPGMSQNMKMVYAYITYIVFGVLYTGVNIPYGSLASVMSSNPDERTSLSTFRTLGSMIAGLLVMVIAPKLVLSNGVASPSGFFICALLFGIISIVSFIYTFRLTRERIVREADINNGERKSIGQIVKVLFKNRAFVGVTLASFAIMSGQFTSISLTAYLFKDYFKTPGLITLGGVALTIPVFIVIPFIGKIVRKFGKKESILGGLAIVIISYAILLFIPSTNPYFYIVMALIAGIGNGVFNSIVWAVVTDAIEYQEYLSGERNEGIVYSVYSLFRKLSQAVAGGIGGFALGFLGYKSGATEQTLEVGTGIKNLLYGTNLIATIITFLIMLFIYNLSKKKLNEVTNELKNRRIKA